MLKPSSRPSLTSLVAFFLIVAPVIYVLSYAPVVRLCGRTIEGRIHLSEIPFPQGSIGLSVSDFGDDAIALPSGDVLLPWRVADASLYPPYRPVDWLMDHTPLRGPLLTWAELWGVQEAFEVSEFERFLLDQSRAGSTGR